MTELIRHIAAVDRFGNEANGAVHHADVDAARVVARRGNAHTGPAFARIAVLEAARAVRRHSGVEVGVRGARVGPTAAFDRPLVCGARHTFGSAGREAVGGGQAVNVRAAERALVHDVVPGGLRNVNFAERHRVSRAVGDCREGHPSADSAVEENAAHIAVLAPVRADHPVAAAAAVVRTAAVGTAEGGRLVIAVRRAKIRGDDGRERVRAAVGHIAARPRKRDDTGPAVRIQRRSLRAVAGDCVHQRRLFDVRKNQREDRVSVDDVDSVFRAALAEAFNPEFVVVLVRDTIVRIVEVLDRKPELFQVVRALHPARRFTGRLDSGKEQADQNTDDRDNDQ